MKRFTSETQVSGGYYLNTTSWTIHAVEGLRGLLPGAAGTQAVRLATPLMAVAALVLSLAFVIFLPVIGVALFAWVVAGAIVHGLELAVEKLLHTFAPQWRPGEAWLARRMSPPAAAPAAPSTESLQALRAEVEARRVEEVSQDKR